MTKVKEFFKQKDVYFIIATFFVLFALVASAVTGVFPFGTNTNATYDAWHQVCPLYNLIFDFLEGKASLFYSTSVGGGLNTFGVLTYYVISPFSILFLIFGRGGIYYAYNLVLVLKAITTAVVACYFIRKTFPNINKIYQILFSVLYSVGGYFVMLHTWITWVDFMIYMPLLFLAYKKLLNEEKFLPFSIVMALLIFTCFGIGSFSFIVLFILFVAYNFFCVEKEKQKRTLFLTVVGLLVSIGISLFVLVPSFMQYLGSSRTGGFFEQLFSKPVFNIHMPDKFSTIVGDGILLFFAILYLIKCDKKIPKNKFIIFAFVLLISPSIIDEINILLNMGSYNGYPFRMGFVYSFLVFYMALSLISDKWEEYSNKTESNKKFVIDFSIIGGIFVCVLALVFFMLGPIISGFLANQQTSWGVFLCYFLIVLLVVFPLAIVLLNTRNGNLSKRFLTIVFIVATLLQTTLNFGFSAYGDTSDFKIVPTLSQMIKDNNISSETMIKNASKILTRNSHLDIGLKSYSIFSSSTDRRLSDMKKDFCYIVNGTGVSSYGGTILGDALFGYEYFITDKIQNRPYLTLVDSYTEDGLSCYLYKNNLVLNGGYVVDKNFSYEKNDDYVITTNNIYKNLGGVGELIKEYPFADNENLNITYTNINPVENDDKYTLDVVDGNKEGFMTISYTATEDNILYLFTNNKDVNKIYTLTDRIEVEGFRTVSYSLECCLNDLGFVQAGETISVDLRVIEDVTFSKTGENALSFAVLNYQNAENLLNIMIASSQNNIDVVTNKNGFTITTTQLDNKKIVFLHPFSENYLCTLNGQNVDIKNFNGAIEIDLTSGENKIELAYKNPYTKLMLLCLGIGAVMVVGIILVMKFFKEKLLKLSSIIRVLCFALALILCAFFYVFPFGTMLVKMCLGIF